MLQNFKSDEPRRLPHRIDLGGLTETIQGALAGAGLNTHSGPMKRVTDTITQALSSAGLTQRPLAPTGQRMKIDGTARNIDAPCGDIGGAHAKTGSPVDGPHPGAFLERSFTNDAGTREYMLYVPAAHAVESSEPVPLIVMLHGCTQSPGDFASGTRMNELADRHGFLVIYPAQAANANGSRCWNWFRPDDQIRDSGEPSLIAGITREVATEYCVNAGQIFVAGLSAGASMAVILGAMYPDLYAAVGAHSGLPYGAAHDMPSAFSAMQGASSLRDQFVQSAAAPIRRVEGSNCIPTIVFHGDNDRTVSARNADAIVDQIGVAGAAGQPLRPHVETGTAPGGRRYRRTNYMDHTGQTIAEHWTVHGAGHAWSGGSRRGSFTDPTGPDASAEMVRFFLSQRRAGIS